MILVSYSLFVRFLRAITLCAVALLTSSVIGMERKLSCAQQLPPITEFEEENIEQLWPSLVEERQRHDITSFNATLESCVRYSEKVKNREEIENSMRTLFEVDTLVKAERYYDKWHNPLLDAIGALSNQRVRLSELNKIELQNLKTKKPAKYITYLQSIVRVVPKPEYLNPLVKEALKKNDLIGAHSYLEQYDLNKYDASSLYQRMYKLAMGKGNFKIALRCASRCSKNNQPDPELYTSIFDKALKTKNLASIIHPALQPEELTPFVEYLQGKTLPLDDPMRLSVYEVLANQGPFFLDGLSRKKKRYLEARIEASRGNFFKLGNLFKTSKVPRLKVSEGKFVDETGNHFKACQGPYNYSAFCSLIKELCARKDIFGPALLQLLTDGFDRDLPALIEAIEKYKVLPSVEKLIEHKDELALQLARLLGTSYSYMPREYTDTEFSADDIEAKYLKKSHELLSAIKPENKEKFTAEIWESVVCAQSSTLARLADKAKLRGNFSEMLDWHTENLTWSHCDAWKGVFDNFATFITGSSNKEDLLLKIKKFMDHAERYCTEKNPNSLYCLGRKFELGFNVQLLLKKEKTKEIQQALLVPLVEKNREKAELYYKKVVESPFAGKMLKEKAFQKLGALVETDLRIGNVHERFDKALEFYNQMRTGKGIFERAAVSTARGNYADSQRLCTELADHETQDRKLLSVVHALRATNGIRLQDDPHVVSTPYMVAQDVKMMLKNAQDNRKATYWHYLSTKIDGFLESASKNIVKKKEITSEDADLLATYVLYKTRRIKQEQMALANKQPLSPADIIKLISFASHSAKLGNILGCAVLADLLIHHAVEKYASNKLEKKPTILPMQPVSLLYKAYQSNDVWVKGIAWELLEQLAHTGHLPCQAILIAEHKDDLESLSKHLWWKEPVYKPLFNINLDEEAFVFLKKLLDKECISKLHEYAKNNSHSIPLTLFLMNLHTQNAVNLFNTPKSTTKSSLESTTTSYDREEMDYINQNLVDILPYYHMLLQNEAVPKEYKDILKGSKYTSLIAAAEHISKSRIESKEM